MAVRVAHLIHGLDLGGLEQLVVQLASRTKARGIETSLLALGEDGPVRQLAQKHGLDVELLPVAGLSVPALLGIRKALEKRSVTHLHAHDLGPWLNAVAVGYLGGLREIKGPDKLLQAFLDKFPDREDVRLHLVGAGPMEAQLKQMARGHSNVHFAGLIPEAARLLPGLDVYAQTSLSEGRSLSMLEAMAAGLPTLAHDLLPVREIHENEVSALLAPLGDRAALGNALARLATDADLRARLGAEAKKRAQRHSIEPMVDAYEALYRERS